MNPIAMMAGVSGGDGSEVASDTSQPTSIIAPTAISSSETSLPSLPVAITAFKLTGPNFIPWSRSIQMLIRGKGKFGYLDGSIPQPPKDDPSLNTWEMNNSLVMSWLIHSMDSRLGELYLLYPTAKAIWDARKLAYSDLEDSSQMFALRTKARNLRQDEGSVTSYFHSLSRLWQELDLFQQQNWHDPADAEIYRRMLAKERIYDFLAGLNTSLDEVRGRILGSKPLPSLDAIFAEVRREEHRKTIMLGTSPTPPVDASAMAVRSSDNRFKKGAATWCDFCHKPYHTKAKCWKLHGKPADWVPKHIRDREQSGNTASAKVDDAAPENPFTKAQLDHLTKLMSSSNVRSSLMAQSGNTSSHFTDLSCEPWIIDSGASDHMTGSRRLLTSYSPCTHPRSVKIANGSMLTILGTGTVELSPTLCLKNVLYVPKFSCNLLSISQLTAEQNLTAIFNSASCQFQDQTSGQVIGSAREFSGLYYFSRDVSSSNNHRAAVGSTTALSRRQKIILLHCRLGHPSFLYLKRLFPSLFRNKDTFSCDICQLAKHQRIPFSPKPYQISHPFALIHSDLWGPSRIITPFHQKWFVTFIDDHTRVCWVYLLKEKSEVPQIFEKFHSMIKTQYNAPIKIIRTDNGTEYFNSVLNQFLSTNGLLHHSSCVDSPQQNGISERKNRHLLEVARSLLFTANVPKRFWGDAILTACFLINRQPSKVLNFNTPLSCLRQSYPKSRSFSELELRVFGCKAFVHNFSPSKSKLDPRSLECVFLGYSSTQKGYCCYCPSTKKYYVSHDVSFFENQSFFPTNSL